jgi:orotidine-5'-phosphate decarboxylase
MLVGEAQTKVILALDFDRLEQAKRMVEVTSDKVDMYKVGSILFTGYGQRVIDAVKESGKGIFLDLKFHDIPNTVKGAVRAAAALGVGMLTVHASGGVDMMQAALEGAGEGAAVHGRRRPLVVGVTLLTSMAGEGDMTGRILDLAGKAAEAGIDGVVCSVLEVAEIKRAFGERLVAVVPGIRLSDQAADDQARVGTPAQAAARGADFIVVGRSVTKSKHPGDALARVLEEVGNA